MKTMNIAIFSILAIAFYFSGTLCQWERLRGRNIQRVLIQAVVFAGALAQTLSIYLITHTQKNGITLNFFTVGSLSSWMVILIILVSSLRKPVDNLLIALLPMTIASVACSFLLTGPEDFIPSTSLGIIFHIIISILSYSTLTVAAVQAVLLAWQERRLKHHHPSSIIKAFPPMQTMEKLLFEFLWAGLILLTLSLGTGFMYLNDMFAQHVAHKTVLSVTAWCLFSILLAGRHIMGWRGQTAIRWTLAGFACLMLAYFGSKLILDMIINRS
ncbi:MAG: cytochrome c biogenesis protein CcsA [Endozoicomonadaceae bacterium]|nr:cytochrome c biogenesis protein CcsA [Endozoicomonadaceae bacterium]